MIKILNKDLSNTQMNMLKKLAVDSEFTIEEAATSCLCTFLDEELYYQYSQKVVSRIGKPISELQTATQIGEKLGISNISVANLVRETPDNIMIKPRNKRELECTKYGIWLIDSRAKGNSGYLTFYYTKEAENILKDVYIKREQGYLKRRNEYLSKLAK